jgi:hypothetical protein
MQNFLVATITNHDNFEISLIFHYFRKWMKQIHQQNLHQPAQTDQGHSIVQEGERSSPKSIDEHGSDISHYHFSISFFVSKSIM